MLKLFLHRLLTLIFRVKVIGLDHYHQAGKRVLIVANHTSFLDPLLLGVFLPVDSPSAIRHQNRDFPRGPYFGHRLDDEDL